MTFRQNFRCKSCGKIIAFRIQIGYRPVELVSVPCPECAFPISAELHLDQDKGEVLGFERLKGIDLVGEADADFVVNHSPDFAQSAGKGNADGISSFIEAFQRAGGGEEFIHKAKRQQLMIEIAADHSDKIRHMIETYRQEKWKYFEPLGSEYLDAGESIDDPITRESTLLRAMEHYIAPLVLSENHVKAIQQIHEWIVGVIDADRDAFARLIADLSQLGYLDEVWHDGLDLYLRIFDAMEHFRQILTEWDPEQPNAVDVADIKITSAPAYDYLKSLYVDGYEFLARVLTMAAGLENLERRGDHEKFPPHARYKDFSPKSLREFQEKSNAPKVDYLESSVAQQFASAMEPALRNGLGHFSARYDSKTGIISYQLSKGGPETRLPYASFLLRLVRLAMRIQEAIYFVKFLRTYEKGRQWDQVISYGVNDLGLRIAVGSRATDEEPCAACGHALQKHTAAEGVLSEFAPFIDCDSCECSEFVHSKVLYTLDDSVTETRLR